MKISVFGVGYVGLVTGVCFAEMGNDVICADIDAKRIARLKDGISPIYEPGLDDLITSNLKAKRIQFTLDIAHAVRHSDLLFIAVGTPSDVDGSSDLRYVYQVAEDIGKEIDQYKVVINKSTVPIGTQKEVKERIQNAIKKRGLSINFDVVSNPEFLREGTAIEECLKPARVIIGCENEKSAEFMRKLYEPFLKGAPLLLMDPCSSEMTKYAANAMLATKISMMNEFSRVCERVGADIESVRRGIGTDERIGPHFIYAGVGYGGSCFPKDIKSLIHTGGQVGQDLKILKSVDETNQLQRQNFFDKIKSACGNSLRGKKIGLWGVAFKPGTDDIREAPAIYLMRQMLDHGATISIYDPVAEANAKEHFGNDPHLSFYADQYEALQSVDVLVIATEWKSFRNPDFDRMKQLMKSAVICDGRNLYHPADLRDKGFNYLSVGRPAVVVVS